MAPAAAAFIMMAVIGALADFMISHEGEPNPDNNPLICCSHEKHMKNDESQ